MDRNETVGVFRARLQTLIDRSGLSRAAFAGRVGMDRSTLSQLLSAETNRMPRAEAVIAIADAGQVTCDWLLGRTQDEQRGPELLSAAIEVENDAASPMDERLLRWHQEAAGYKVRYVPTTLPDLLKTERVIHYEGVRLTEAGGLDSGRRRAADQLRYSRDPDAVMEVCSSWQSLRALSRGEGQWQALDIEARREQLETMIRRIDELYPAFRWSLYDGRAHYAAPITVFGSQRAVIYLGELYFVFNTSDHIRVLMARFDGLVKAAVVQPTGIADFLRREIETLDAADG